MTEPKLISIRQAAAQGIDRLRMPCWAHPCDHLKIDIINGAPGPWAHLFSIMNRAMNGRDPCTELMLSGLDTEEFVPYSGPLPGGDAYCAQADAFEEAVKRAESNGAEFGESTKP